MGIVKIIRHSDYGADGKLIPQGVERAREYGRLIRGQYPNYGVIAYSSDADRAKQTAKYILEGDGMEPDERVDERLSYSYTPEESDRIDKAIKSESRPSTLEASIQEAPDTLYRDIINLAAFVDEHTADTENNIYIGVSHSPTIDGIEYIIASYNKLKTKPDYLQGFALSEGIFTPDRAISCGSLVRMCQSGWEMISK